MSGIVEKEVQLATGNGVREYEASVESASPSKEDVEARLKSTSESISLRLDAIQDEIGSAGEAIKKVFTDNPLAAVLLAVGAGVAVGLVVGGGSGKTSSVPRSVVSGIAGAISDAMEDGASPDEAAYDALDEFEAYLKPPKTKPRKSSLSGFLVRAGMSMLVREGLKRFNGSEPSSTD
ncbi:MAG: hypothetical protein HKN43_00540 [Rhodothermales bacterium]|nr:hypothetical protein [Rhodothermales bacterium]